ncbi:MAG: glycoside hydrolase family 2 protein, partial [Aggregatilineales bacterium]
RRVEHALRHARVQSQAAMMGGVSGAIGWCAFDYNTHKEFGSGDRICYHGVMDIFRQPKWAAHFYGSQISPDERIVLEPATGWTMGDRSVGGVDPFTVFTNCDEIEIFVADKSEGRFQPDVDSYPGLPHSPVTVTGVLNNWGDAFSELKIIGYINGEAVATKQVENDSIPRALELSTSHETLNANGADMCWLWFKIVDKYGNPLPYGITVVTFTIEGPGELIGENPFPLVGGQGGLFIKSTEVAGTITVRAHAAHLAPVEIQVKSQ